MHFYLHSKYKRTYIYVIHIYKYHIEEELGKNAIWINMYSSPIVNVYTVDSHYREFQGTLRDIRTSKYQNCRSEENNKSKNHTYQMNM